MQYFIVDAFSDTLFTGNQAGVCPLETWPEDALLQSIAKENNLSETAFFVPEAGAYRLRWFTPAVEIALCGHATLATAFVLFSFYDTSAASLYFRTVSGMLTVTRKGDRLEMDFPARSQTEIPISSDIERMVDFPILAAYAGYNLTLLLADAAAVKHVKPNLDAIRKLREYHGVIVTAPGEGCDFVSRFFAPSVGIDEDPVTGSTHTSLVPYWAQRLGKDSLVAQQLSIRGGTLWCRNEGERVFISGKACLYLTGRIQVPVGIA